MKKNEGFSLVELIIVIAIMAILVGIMAPIMIRYLEKTNVSSDTQLADSIRTAVMISITDAKVLEDSASQPFLDDLEGASGLNIDTDASFTSSACVLRESLEGILGMPVTDLTNELKSTHGAGAHINVQVFQGNNIRVTITETDNTAKKDKSSSTPANDIFVE